MIRLIRKEMDWWMSFGALSIANIFVILTLYYNKKIEHTFAFFVLLLVIFIASNWIVYSCLKDRHQLSEKDIINFIKQGINSYSREDFIIQGVEDVDVLIKKFVTQKELSRFKWNENWISDIYRRNETLQFYADRENLFDCIMFVKFHAKCSVNSTNRDMKGIIAFTRTHKQGMKFIDNVIVNDLYDCAEVCRYWRDIRCSWLI